MSETEPLLMSETEPLWNSEELEIDKKPFDSFSVFVAILLIVGIGIGVVWLVVIPNYIQREIDTGMGNFILDNLNIRSIGNRKIHFEVKSKIQIIQDHIRVPVTAEVAANTLSIQLRRDNAAYRSILAVGTPHYYYSTDESMLNMSFQDVVLFKNLELLSTLISDFCLNNSNFYSLQLISYPKVSIPGLPGSWKLKFQRAFNFIATSGSNISLLDKVTIKEYKIKTGKGEDGLPKVVIAANATVFNSEAISVPLIDARLTCQIFYKKHHVLNVQITNIFLNPSSTTYPLPMLIETVDWTALQELICKYSEGQDVVVNLKYFQWHTDQTQLKWIQRLVYGLDFSLTLPKLSEDGIFKLCRRYTKEKLDDNLCSYTYRYISDICHVQKVGFLNRKRK